MERAVYERDASYDGAFFVAVRTTNIFCRPSCPARKPLAENMRFYRTAREALFAGFRPCRRCRPLATQGQPPDWVAGLLERVEKSPSRRVRDAELRRLGIDPARARRYFQRHFGLTFQGYCRSRRLGDALRQIREGAALDDVAFSNGYESHSGFRDAFGKTHGRPPGACRDAECIWTQLIESPLGPMVVGAVPEGICLVEFSDRRMLETQFAVLRRHFRCAIVPGSHPHLDQAQRELSEYFAGRRTVFHVPLVYPGSPFQRRVWESLLRIPYGETRSYQELAADIGVPRAVRAVGRANGQNRIGILIPCHRVINKGGRLGGYGGGLWRKERLLELERQNVRSAVPTGRGFRGVKGN